MSRRGLCNFCFLSSKIKFLALHALFSSPHGLELQHSAAKSAVNQEEHHLRPKMEAMSRGWVPRLLDLVTMPGVLPVLHWCMRGSEILHYLGHVMLGIFFTPAIPSLCSKLNTGLLTFSDNLGLNLPLNLPRAYTWVLVPTGLPALCR